jgi:macrolide transport system ATP-binding/permease protein
VGSPSLLLCDEPTGNLDSRSSKSILDLFEKLNDEGLTLVVVTHDEGVARRAARRVHIVDGAIQRDSATGSEKATHGPAPGAAEPKRTSVSRSGVTFRDLFNEALAGMLARPTRMALTVLGVVIGVTALVATIGLTRTAGNRIISQFDQLAATEIFVSAKPGRSTGIIDPRAIPWDAADRLRRLNGVVAAGTVETGRLPDLGHSHRADRVAVLGPDAARRLGIQRLDQLPAISIGDDLYLVIGILSDVARRPELLGAAIIPEGTARRDFRLEGPSMVVVETRIGAAYLIADQARTALRPEDPRALKVEVPLEPRRVRDEVQTDLNVMFLLLGGLSLVVGAIGIANITLVGVMERTGEIGLRRAIGATRSHIAAQFLLESASMGVIGGIIGASIGVLIVVAVAAYQIWTPVLDPAAPFLAPVVGGAIGLVSGTYPALRAAQLEPVEAFRS